MVINLSDEDWESYHLYYERRDIVNKIVAGVIEWHESKTNQ